MNNDHPTTKDFAKQLAHKLSNDFLLSLAAPLAPSNKCAFSHEVGYNSADVITETLLEDQDLFDVMDDNTKNAILDRINVEANDDRHVFLMVCSCDAMHDEAMVHRVRQFFNRMGLELNALLTNTHAPNN